MPYDAVRGRQIARGELAALGHDVIVDALTFVEGRHAGALDGADVNEHILRAIRRGDKAETFLRVEELNGTCGHVGLLTCSIDRALTIEGAAFTSEFWGIAFVSAQDAGAKKADQQIQVARII
jgi:hypothetical protein